MQKKADEILIHHEISKKIAKELDITYQTVLMAKKYINNSKVAEKIRLLCKVALLEEAKKIKIEIKEDQKLEIEINEYLDNIKCKMDV